MLSEKESCNFTNKFLSQSWQTEMTYCQGKILSSCHNTTHISRTFRLPFSIELTKCSQDPEQRASDGGQSSKGLTPSMQYVPCHTMQWSLCKLNKRNRHLSSNTNRLIPKNGHIPLHWVFPRLKIQIEDMHLPCFFLFVLASAACTLSWLVSAKTTFLKAFITFRKAFFASFSFEPPRTIFSDTNSMSCACSSPMNALPVPLNRPLPFPVPFPFFFPHLAALE